MASTFFGEDALAGTQMTTAGKEQRHSEKGTGNGNGVSGERRSMMDSNFVPDWRFSNIQI